MLFIVFVFLQYLLPALMDYATEHYSQATIYLKIPLLFGWTGFFGQTSPQLWGLLKKGFKKFF